MRVFLFTLILALLSAAIAYVGDIVGRQVAKRRISIAGIRPRRVGSYVAVATGVVIALSTFGLLALTSRDIRMWVVEYDKIKADLADLKLQYATTSQANESLKVGIAKMQKELDARKAELDTLGEDLASTEETLTKTSAGLEKSQSDLSSVNTKLSSNERELSKTQSKLKDAGSKEGELRKNIGSLETDNESLRRNRDSLVGEIAALEKDRLELENKTKNLENQYELLSREVDSLSAKLGDLRTKNILIGANQPLAYISIDSTWTGAQVRDAILSTLSVLRQKLAAKGYSMEDVTNAEIETLVSGLAGVQRNEVVIVSSAENVVPESAVSLNYFVIENKLCFKKDEIVVEFSIPKGAGSSQVEELFAIAIKAMRARADERNLLPDIDSGSVGSFNYDEIKRLIAKLAKGESDFTVYFVSTENVYTTGNLSKVKIKTWAK
jgi:uncharacterized protein (DUF3084 family)